MAGGDFTPWNQAPPKEAPALQRKKGVLLTLDIYTS
jgi:hypothetical protein